jgi:hypothetical protein
MHDELHFLEIWLTCALSGCRLIQAAWSYCLRPESRIVLRTLVLLELLVVILFKVGDFYRVKRHHIILIEVGWHIGVYLLNEIRDVVFKHQRQLHSTNLALIEGKLEL